jgi:hypothetical protein
VGGETPVPIEAGAKIVLHLVPLSAFGSLAQVDLKLLPQLHSLLAPIYRGPTWEGRFNFDGYLIYRSGDSSIYLQVFRNGIIETANSSVLNVYEGRRSIPSVDYEKHLLEKLPRYVEAERRLGIEPPFVLMVSLLEVLGYNMSTRHLLFPDPLTPREIDRDNLLPPEVYIEGATFDTGLLMKPIFDAIWNAAGWEGSINYDGNKWVGQPLR